MKKQIFISFCLVFFVFSIKAQTKYKETEFKTHPIWIIMMDDSAVNYYQAIKAFNTYWEDKISPIENEANSNEKETEKNKKKKQHERYEKKLAAMTAEQRNEFDRINYEYKRFLNWMYEMKPYVQANGSILSRQQRLDMWKHREQKNDRQ
jgi:Skp family chaperone for outer membrane proteins